LPPRRPSPPPHRRRARTPQIAAAASVPVICGHVLHTAAGSRAPLAAPPRRVSLVSPPHGGVAMPGGTVSLYELGMEAPLWWEDWNDTPRGRGKAGLLDRCRVSNTCPKIMETFGSAEIWGLRASPML